MAKSITYIAEAKTEESERAYFPWQETWNLLQKKQKEKRDKPLESNHWVHWVRQSNFSSLIFLMTKTSYLFHRNYNRKGNKSQPLEISQWVSINPFPFTSTWSFVWKTVQHIHLKCQRCQCASRTCPRGSVTKPPRVSRSIFVSQVIWIFIGSPVDWILICSLLYSVVLYLLACILSRSSSAHPLTEFWQNYTSMFYTIEYYRTYSFVFLFTEYQLFLGSPVEVKL